MTEFRDIGVAMPVYGNTFKGDAFIIIIFFAKAERDVTSLYGIVRQALILDGVALLEKLYPYYNH